MKLSDEWMTPQWLFDELNKEFDFDIDLCSNGYNGKCNINLTDYLNFDMVEITGASCFMNPPYSNPRPFIEKAWEDSKHCKIICLVKCDPSTRWWAIFWNYEEKRQYSKRYLSSDYDCSNEKPFCYGCGFCRPDQMCFEKLEDIGPKPGCEVRFFSKRIKFEHSTLKGSGPAFPSALVIMNRRNVEC